MRDEAADTPMKASRERNWDERTDMDRIQILREELMITRRIVETMANQISSLLQHQHAGVEIVIPLRATQSTEGGSLYGYRYNRLA